MTPAICTYLIHARYLPNLDTLDRSDTSYYCYTIMTPPTGNVTSDSALRDSKGWDGKLRVGKRAVITNAEAFSDPENSDEDIPPVQQLEADEGKRWRHLD